MLGVPLNPPVHHPFNPLLALRASGVPMEDAQRDALITGLFEAVWVNGQHVSEAAVVEEVANAAGLDEEAVKRYIKNALLLVIGFFLRLSQ